MSQSGTVAQPGPGRSIRVALQLRGSAGFAPASQPDTAAHRAREPELGKSSEAEGKMYGRDSDLSTGRQDLTQRTLRTQSCFRSSSLRSLAFQVARERILLRLQKVVFALIRPKLTLSAHICKFESAMCPMGRTGCESWHTGHVRTGTVNLRHLWGLEGTLVPRYKLTHRTFARMRSRGRMHARSALPPEAPKNSRRRKSRPPRATSRVRPHATSSMGCSCAGRLCACRIAKELRT